MFQQGGGKVLQADARRGRFDDISEVLLTDSTQR